MEVGDRRLELGRRELGVRRQEVEVREVGVRMRLELGGVDA